MAISIEEDKKGVNWVSILTIFIIIVVVFAGAYFLFFKKPELVEVVVPGRFEDISKFSDIEFNPREVLESSEFKVLRQFQTEVEVSTPGKNNPFMH